MKRKSTVELRQSITAQCGNGFEADVSAFWRGETGLSRTFHKGDFTIKFFIGWDEDDIDAEPGARSWTPHMFATISYVPRNPDQKQEWLASRARDIGLGSRYVGKSTKRRTIKTLIDISKKFNPELVLEDAINRANDRLELYGLHCSM